MLRIILLVSALAVAAGLLACGSANSNNSNAGNMILVNAANNGANVNANGFVPGSPTISVSPEINATPATPPANVATLPKGTAPTPGNVNKPKPVATPTPGPPDQEAIRRQLQGIDSTNLNAAPGGDMRMRPLKKGTNKPANNQ